MKTYAQLIDDIIDREGIKFTDTPGDLGGATKFGITLATLAAWRHKPVTILDVQALKEDEARQIYMQEYIVGPGYKALTNTMLVEQMIDAGVQHSVHEAIELLQHALKLPANGVLSSQTITAANAAHPIQITIFYLACRLKFYANLLEHPDEKKFDSGWINRCAGLLAILGVEISQ